MTNSSLALIIPTTGRMDCIKRLLESVIAQSVRPGEIIIVNGGDVDISDIKGDFKELNIKYIVSQPPFLTRQRNIGISALDRRTALVGFLDDDIVLKDNTLENMLKFWNTADPKIGGASFNNISDTFKKAGIIEKIFGVNGIDSGKILKSGMITKICSIERTKCVDWLLGGATVWRREVVDKFKFDEWFAGYAPYEDADYSYRVGEKYDMMVIKDAMFYHFPIPISADKEYLYGKMHVINRVYFVKKSPRLSLPVCYWACLGMLLSNLARGVSRQDKRFLRRAAGNIAGLANALTNNLVRIEGDVKK